MWPLMLDAFTARRCFTLRPFLFNDSLAVTRIWRVWFFEVENRCDICDSHKLIYVTALFLLTFFIGCDICDICDICDKRGLSQTPFLSNENNAVTRMRFYPPTGDWTRPFEGRWSSRSGQAPVAKFVLYKQMGGGAERLGDSSKWENTPGANGR